MSTTQDDPTRSPLLSPHGDEGAAMDLSDLPDSILPLDDTTMSTAQHIYTPPPHLAARFYRTKAAGRRKSSATSSRRNSLSSVHSHASSLSHHRRASGCQSNYIAQHLRRASIIESRKARLADRAAHAEQVRLRAALAKAAPRGSTSNSEERALAAQVAKEKYLAKVAAACAEEVARAKRVAEEVKERKLAEETRARLEMEERHAEAERRRAEYQRNLQARRARRADSSEKKLSTLEEVLDGDEEAVVDEVVVEKVVLSEEEAAKRLQRIVRLFLKEKVVKVFREMELHAKSKRESFEDMTALVADTHTITATTAILMQLGLQDRNDENAALNSRTFLSAYMITGHPVAVLNNKNGAQEQDLMAKATELIENFEVIVGRLSRWNNFSPNPTQLENLSQAYTAYTSAFAAWRLQDSSVLIEGMVASFVELDAIWQTVKDDTRGEVASDYREGIRDNQVMLLSRIRKLAGPDRADVLIKKAIRESRRKRPKKRATAEVRPRGVESADAQSSAQPALEAAVESDSDDARPISPAGDVDLEQQVRQLFTPMPSNRVLTHELAIDKDYRLEDTQSEFRAQFYRSLCDNMKRGFENGNGTVWTVSAAQNVSEKLLRMLKPGNSMHTLISETLDADSINRQCQQGVFSYDGFFKFMADVLPKLCAPFRDAEIKALASDLQDSSSGELDAMIEKLFKLMRAVDLLSLDYTNFMIMNAAPTLIREAPGYEQRMFAKDLESGALTLDRTREFCRSSYVTLSAEADRRDPEGVRLLSDRPSLHRVYAHALCNLALDIGPLPAEAVPETLALDLARLREVRTQTVRITIIAAILLNAKNLLRRDSRSQWKNEASRLWTLLSSEAYDGSTSVKGDAGPEEEERLSTASKALAILETSHNIPPATRTTLSGSITRFFAQAASTHTRFTDPLLKILHSRLRSHILARLSASTSSERVRVTSGASEALSGFGMPEFVERVGGVVGVLERVRGVDGGGHGGWYDEIFGELSR
ncbi:uncharacterized protein LTR77_004658 [Saxophila tyrrhenica]|uniref:Uncharacterized protein n=1 Tax=Saxophila tyrrhenica TaxID=1690608 RepID=A0AAV9PEI7_9PEZI|nr:hypothetical protein LTR77_004658 [Saxophila tyrrhenica]